MSVAFGTRPAYLKPAGTVAWDAETDKYGNKVTLVTTEFGRGLRMVAHPKANWSLYRAKLYIDKDMHLPFKLRSPENDCYESTLALAGYGVSWGDADHLGSRSDPRGPDINEQLDKLAHMDRTGFVLCVVNALHAAQWPFHETKASELAARAAQPEFPRRVRWRW